MEIIAKISKGTKMDQVYIPKKRAGLVIGSYVQLRQLETFQKPINPFYYGVKHLEPLKVEIIHEIFGLIEKVYSPENMIITGSFLENGWHFNDIDIVIISKKKIPIVNLREMLTKRTGIKMHLLQFNPIDFKKQLEVDPTYLMMLSRCISKKRLIFNIKSKFRYKLLDIALLESETLPINFDDSSGSEKFTQVRNLISVHLFVNNKKVTLGNLRREITNIFDTTIDEIKSNILDKSSFIRKYKTLYNKTFEKIMKGVKNESKQTPNN